MINYLAALGWNDGTDKEIYSVDEIIEGFDVDRVNASPSMFDLQKLKWVNGQHIRALEPVYLEPMLKEFLEESDLLGGPELSQAFLSLAVANTQEKMELLAEAVPILETVLSFPFEETVDGDEAADIISDNFSEVTAAIVASFDAGEMPIGEEDNFDALWKKWVKNGCDQGAEPYNPWPAQYWRVHHICYSSNIPVASSGLLAICSTKKYVLTGTSVHI